MKAAARVILAALAAVVAVAIYSTAADLGPATGPGSGGGAGTAAGLVVVGGSSKAPDLPSNVSLWEPSSGGVPPNPYSTLVLDSKIFFAAARGGVADTDGSMWFGQYNPICTAAGTPWPCCSGAGTGSCTGPGAGVRDATSDWIRQDGTLSFQAAGATKYNRQTTAANAADTWFCGDNVTFAPCSTGASCVESLTLGDEAGVFCETSTGLCEPVAASDYLGCNSASETLQFTTPPYGEGAGTFQKALPDGIHDSQQLARMKAQALLLWPSDMFIVPPVNGINNGGTVTDCTGWIKSSDGTGSGLNVAAVSRPSGYTGGAIRAGCSASGAGQKLLTGVQNVKAGRWYFARGYTRLNETGAQTLTVQAVNATTPWAAITGTQKTYMVKGARLVDLASQTTARDRECYGSCYMLVIYRPDADGQVRISFSGSSTGVVAASNWIGGEREQQSSALVPLQPASTLASWRFETDSRGDAVTEIIGEFDAIISAGILRPGLRLAAPATDVSRAEAGRRLEYMVCDAAAPSALCTVPTTDDVEYENYSTVDAANETSLTVLQLTVNDVAQGATANTIRQRIHAATQRIRATGSRPLYILEPPYRADTTFNQCASSSNCGVLIEDVNAQVLFTYPEELHK